MMKIDVKIMDARMAAQLPAYATSGSAGLDLRACLDAPLTLGANAWQLVPTGIALRLSLCVEAVREATEEEIGRGSAGTGFFRIAPPHEMTPGNETRH